MFNLLRRKPEVDRKSAPAAAQPQPNKHAAPSNAMDHLEVIGRCIQHHMDHATFLGSLDVSPAYQAQVMPNGMQVAASQTKRIGVVMDARMVGIAAAGVNGMNMACVAASGYFKNYQKHEPEWQLHEASSGAKSLRVQVPFGTNNLIEMTCSDGSVDTQFDGKTEPGCTLTIKVRRSA